MRSVLGELERLRIRVLEDGEDSPGIALFKRALLVGNKKDLDLQSHHYDELAAEYGSHLPIVALSATTGQGLEELRQAVFQTLGVIRVYPKAPGQKPDLDTPIIIKRGSTIEEIAESIHKDLRRRLKYALVWGSTKFGGQRVPRDYQPQDGDVVELH
jgi:hypothetical protein